MKTVLCALLGSTLPPWLGQAEPAPTSLLNISYDVQTAFVGEAKAQKVHFDDGGTFGQIYLL